ncbi:uncharacterized protein [Garra rufa]|uniref:uncharacterized protein n=1 Tax=Garra rufa TaxID=137080 RepID=UPI003CCED170
MSFSLAVHDVFFAGITNSKEGESVTLETGVNELQKDDVMLWMFGPLSPDIFMAEINRPLQKISYSDDERLRDRLQLNDRTGSLTIMDSRSTDTGVYQLQITNSKGTSYKRYSVFVTVPEPGLSPGAVAVICICMLLVAAAAAFAGVSYYRRKSLRLRNEMKTNKVTERDPIPLHTGIAEPQRYDQILWRFGPQESLISQIPLRNHETSPEDDERFTIDLLYVDSLQFSEGEDITLHTGVELQKDDQILWSFGSEDNIIAKRDGNTSQVLIDGNNGRFRDRLQMDDQTGSLTITNTKSTDAGVYHLQIISRNKVSFKKFTVCLDTVKVKAVDSVSLNTDVTEPENGDNDTGTAEIDQVSSNSETNREDAVESSQSENFEEMPLIRTYSGTSV